MIDASRKVAGDRWQLCLIARIDIPLASDAFPFDAQDADKFLDFQASVGGQVRFENRLVRNFIDEQARKAVFRLMVETFLEDALPYLSHRDFPGKFVFKRFNEYRQLKTRGG